MSATMQQRQPKAFYSEFSSVTLSSGSVISPVAVDDVGGIRDGICARAEAAETFSARLRLYDRGEY